MQTNNLSKINSNSICKYDTSLFDPPPPHVMESEQEAGMESEET
jgi:hypothetical protein